jgi:hypothetical protein
MSISLLGFQLVRKRELDRLRAQISDLQEESQAQVAELTRQLRAAQGERAVLEQAAHDTRDSSQAKLPAPVDDAQYSPAGVDAAGPPAIVRELVNVADRLVDLTGVGAPSDPEQASAVLRWLEVRTQVMLAACGVVRVEDSGSLDLHRHQVVVSRAAPDKDLVDQIADTVRPGYAWHGSLLRPQQVIAYIPANEANES